MGGRAKGGRLQKVSNHVNACCSLVNSLYDDLWLSGEKEGNRNREEGDEREDMAVGS